MKHIASLIKNYVRRIPRRIYILLIISVSMLVLSVIPYAVRVSEEKKLIDQQAADTWSEDGTGMTQISVFYPTGHTTDDFGIRSLQYGISQELIKASLDDGDVKNGTKFVTCTSSQGKISLTREDGRNPIQANAIGTGGDFFRFHPVRLLSGAIYSSTLLVPDHILIDETLAWQLFGSYDIIGRTVNIGDIPHTVDGVFSLDRKGAVESRSLIPDNLCIMSLSSLCQLGQIEGAAPGDNGTDAAAIGTAKVFGIQTFEIIMPSPVKNFALNILREKIKPDDYGIVIVENSTRFSGENLLKALGDFVTAGMQTRPIVYPFWENIARGYTNIFSALYLLQLLLQLPALLLLMICLVMLWRLRRWTFGSLWQSLMDKKYDLESRMKYAHDKWEHF